MQHGGKMDVAPYRSEWAISVPGGNMEPEYFVENILLYLLLTESSDHPNTKEDEK